ncbi:MAG: TRAP transporter substrate-binding protein [Clostridiales bacterium]|nr:TRAP transporter substrate-binding protein [Clostridiales bacterium]
MKKIHKKQLAVVSLCTMMALSVIGCGTTSNTGTAASNTETAAAENQAIEEETKVAVTDTKTYDLRCSTNLAATSTVGQGLARFAELVNEKSEGRINCVANYGSELGSQAEQVAMAMEGDLEMVTAAPGTGPGAYEGCQQLMLFEFPFLFKDNDHYRRVMKNESVIEYVNNAVNPIGFTAMAGQSQGSRDILTNVPVEKLSDMEDLVLRGPNAVYISMFEALGAVGITMDWNEIYTAMSQNVCNGCEGSPSSIHASALEDNGKYLAITNHIIACTYYFFNTDWLNSLPEDLQTIIRECANEAQTYQEEIDDEDQTVALEAMKENGVTVTEITDIDAWREACAPMTEEYLAKGEEWQNFYDLLTSID